MVDDAQPFRSVLGHLMPKIVWRDDEEFLLREIFEDLDPERHPAVRPYKDRLTAPAWDFVLDYLRAELRGVLYTGALIEAMVEEARSLGVAGHEALEIFRRRVRTRSRNFGIADQDDYRFTEISLSPGGAGLAYVAESLRIQAETAMFGESATAPRKIDLTGNERESPRRIG